MLINTEGHPGMRELKEVDEDPGGAGVIQLADPATGSTRTLRRTGVLFDDTVQVFIDHNRWVVWNFVHPGPAADGRGCPAAGSRVSQWAAPTGV